METQDGLVAVLACPRCKGRLVASEAASALDCLHCRVRYPVEEGIPVLMVSRATPLEGGRESQPRD